MRGKKNGDRVQWLGWIARATNILSLRDVSDGWAGGAMMVGLIFGMQLPIAAPLRAMMFGEDSIQAIVKINDDLVLDQQQAGQVELVNQSFQPAKIVGISRSCRYFHHRVIDRNVASSGSHGTGSGAADGLLQ